MSAKSKRILVLNGPNLNLLGRRQPEIYGTVSLDEIIARVRQRFPDVIIDHLQSNHEGVLIDALHEAGYGAEPYDGIVFNAGGFTHTSVALADAVAAIPVPVIEVHLSDISAREPFRRHSYLSPVCAGTIGGRGAEVYPLAVSELIKMQM